MRFAKHSHIEGRHAMLSASSHAWTNYDIDKLEAKIRSELAAARGTRLHELAKKLIDEKIPLPDTTETLNMYVNDAIGFRMESEQILYYSDNCFGTTDAISFRQERDELVLRIHDLKTGLNETSVRQLEVYAALFCLEYNQKPFDFRMEFRIYQNDAVKIFEGDPLTVTNIMEQIKLFDRKIDELRMEAM